MEELFAELLKVAAHGPTGLKRSAAGALLRAGEELQELLAATTPVEIAEESGDVLYYLLLANHNDNTALSNADLRASLHALAKRVNLSEETIIQCAIAKFSTRFIINSCRKDHPTEWSAIQEVLDAH